MFSSFYCLDTSSEEMSEIMEASDSKDDNSRNSCYTKRLKVKTKQVYREIVTITKLKKTFLFPLLSNLQTSIIVLLIAV